MGTKPLKIAVCVLTYNRKALFIQTMNSMMPSGYSFMPIVVDNGSTDGTAQAVQALGGVINKTDNHTAGYGMNLAITEAMKRSPDIIVFSADDFIYRIGWLAKLIDFWNNAPADVIMASCYLEPLWNWNEIIKTGKAGEQQYVIRTSIPGSSWTFRAADVDKIFPVMETTGGEDLSTCDKLRRQRYRLAALDLVIHAGEEQSAWGNKSYEYAKPLDKKSLGFEDW